jgi:L-iditol 2-dehydrogenase
MQALVYHGPETIKLEEIPPPKPGPDQALVRITAAGVCGSDVEGYLGHTGRRTPPLVMGHELAGTVLEAPEGARVKPGDRVVPFPKLYCGECPACKVGNYQRCEKAPFLGVFSQGGGYTELLAIDPEYLIALGGTVDDSEIALTEPFAVAYHGAAKLAASGLPKEEPVLVIGAGAIGQLTVKALRVLGYQNVIVSDLSSGRLEIAEREGAVATVNVGETDIAEGVKRITGGSLAGGTIEAVGATKPVGDSLSAVKTGGTVVWIGLANRYVEIDMHAVVTRELEVFGSFLYSLVDFTTCGELISSREVDVRGLISEIRPLSEGVEVFRRLSKGPDGDTLKVVLQP